MARYRTKDEADLVWNRTRRQITRDLDTVIQNLREELLNDLLGTAFQRFVEATKRGELVQLEDEASGWIDNLLQSKLRPMIEAQNDDLANG